jgi:5-methylcytosine-specific restriction endonuclease McrA
MSNQVLYDVTVTSADPITGSNQLELPITRDTSMADWAVSTGLVPLIEEHGAFLCRFTSRPIYFHFQTMAGDFISFTGTLSESAPFPIPRLLDFHDGAGHSCHLSDVAGFLGEITPHRNTPESSISAYADIRPHDQSGPSTAGRALRTFGILAKPEECEVLLKLFRKPPKFASIDSRRGRKIQFDWSEQRERKQWEVIRSVFNRRKPQISESAIQGESVFQAVQATFADPDFKFARAIRIVNALNEIVESWEGRWKNSDRSEPLLGWKHRIIDTNDEIVGLLNATDLDGIESDLRALQKSLWTTQHDEEVESARQLEAWLNDKRRNRYGVEFGMINRMRYELSSQGNDPDRAIDIRNNIFERDSKTCQYCGTQLSQTDKSREENNSRRLILEWHLDHVIPLSRGGTNVSHNLQVLCDRCNLWKHNKLESEMPSEITINFYKNQRRAAGD